MSDRAQHPRGSERGNRYSPTGMEVLTGVTRSLVPLDVLLPEHLDIRDIAYGLANQTRFTGHNPLQPSIAQHSLAVCWIAGELYGRSDFGGRGAGVSLALCRAALLHDAAEAYVGDCSGAVKLMMRRLTWGAGADAPVTASSMSPFDELEDSVQAVVEERFDCAPTGYEEIVHEADILACAYEMSRGAWCPESAPPAWIYASAALERSYAYVPRCGPEGYDDHGYGAFLRRAAELGIR